MTQLHLGEALSFTALCQGSSAASSSGSRGVQSLLRFGRPRFLGPCYQCNQKLLEVGGSQKSGEVGILGPQERWIQKIGPASGKALCRGTSCRPSRGRATSAEAPRRVCRRMPLTALSRGFAAWTSPQGLHSEILLRHMPQSCHARVKARVKAGPVPHREDLRAQHWMGLLAALAAWCAALRASTPRPCKVAPKVT